MKTCPECEVDLFEGNPLEKKGDNIPDRLLTVATYQFEALAYLGKAKLESEGIWSMVANAYSHGGAGIGLFIGGGGIGLQVKESDFKEAKRILESCEEANPERQEDYDQDSESEENIESEEVEPVLDEEQRHCPNCNSLNTHSKFSFFHRKHKCESCGHEWNDDSSTQI